MPKVLVIEDNYDIRLSVCEILTHNNYSVCDAEDGEMGIAVLNEEHPDVVLCDVMMPNKDGWETLEYIRKSNRFKNVPFIFTTAMSNTKDMRKGMMLGADDYITKPFYSNDLLGSIKAVLEKRQQLLEEMQVAIRYQDSVDPNSFKNQFKNFEHSLERAKLVQEATLPSTDTLNLLLKDHFLFYQPRDIISGDFYWTKEVDGRVFVAVADCTGHGVPAALMTMACINMLNFVLVSNKEVNARQMVIQAHKLILEFLQADDNNIHDGMDIGLCVIDRNENTINYIGAQRPLFFVSDAQEIECETPTLKSTYEVSKDRFLHKFKGGIQSLGSDNFNENLFEHEFSFSQGDILYLFTDGLIDQFGGIDGKKFKTRRLIDLLDAIHPLELTEQKRVVESFFSEWKGEYEQVDDVTLLGIKL